jgi:hypothetical protein
MNKNDIKSISYKTAFNSKWWEARRSSEVKNSGVGKALDLWQKNCTKPADQMSFAQVQAAEETCQALHKALKAAIAMCGKFQAETKEACQKYMGLVSAFEDELAKRSKTVTNEIAQIMEVFRDLQKNKLPNATKAVGTVASSLSQHQEQLKKLQKQASQTLNETEKANLAKAVQQGQTAVEELQKALYDANKAIDRAVSDQGDKINSARRDSRFRPAIAEYQKDLDKYDSAYSKVLEDTQAVAAEYESILHLVDKAMTSDASLKRMASYRELVVENTLREGIKVAMDNFKKNAPMIVGFLKDPASMTQDQWDQVNDIEDTLAGDGNALKQLKAATERALKLAAPLAKKWKDVSDIQTMFKEIFDVYTKDKKAIEDFFKVAPALKKNIDQLNAQRA